MNATNHAQTFRELHAGPAILLLPNCWDAGSARLLESLGARAVATTSAGLAWSLGYPDGDALPVASLVTAVRAITRTISIPLSVDMEGGYSDDLAAVGDAVAAVADAGGVGINLEDGAMPAADFARKIERAREAAVSAGVDMFINARTDTYLRGLVAEGDLLEETLARARMFRDAGADGFFVPKVVDPAQIREIASSAGLPLNVLAWHGLPPAAELEKLGVRRLSAGSSIAQAAWGRARAVATAFLADGYSEALFQNAMVYGEINPLFRRP